MKYKQWRELSINPYKIPFKNFKLIKIVNYFPAGNDVLECLCDFNGKNKKAIIKIERSKMADFDSEFYNLNILQQKNYSNKIPKILEFGTYEGKRYLVISKINGLRLSEILLKHPDKKKNYLLNYGIALGTIHNISSKDFKGAKQRPINNIPTEDIYKEYDDFIKKYIKYLENNKININHNCFIHGDFHYANLLWKNDSISGIIDFEYSGKGFKEQDIAWALILRPNQKFMNNYKDIKYFLEGYKKISNYDEKTLKWCLINGYCHFYLMNIQNTSYKKEIKKLLRMIINKNL